MQRSAKYHPYVLDDFNYHQRLTITFVRSLSQDVKSKPVMTLQRKCLHHSGRHNHYQCLLTGKSSEWVEITSACSLWIEWWDGWIRNFAPTKGLREKRWKGPCETSMRPCCHGWSLAVSCAIYSFGYLHAWPFHSEVLASLPDILKNQRMIFACNINWNVKW